jgi:hypothetical protein
MAAQAVRAARNGGTLSAAQHRFSAPSIRSAHSRRSLRVRKPKHGDAEFMLDHSPAASDDASAAHTHASAADSHAQDNSRAQVPNQPAAQYMSTAALTPEFLASVIKQALTQVTSAGHDQATAPAATNALDAASLSEISSKIAHNLLDVSSASVALNARLEDMFGGVFELPDPCAPLADGTYLDEEGIDVRTHDVLFFPGGYEDWKPDVLF